MDTKTSKAIQLFTLGDFKKAFQIFATFKMGFTKEEQSTIGIAKECLNGNDRFYKQVGINPESTIQAAKDIIKMKYKL